MPLLNLKNSRFFTFSALNASFLSTQGTMEQRFLCSAVFLQKNAPPDSEKSRRLANRVGVFYAGKALLREHVWAVTSPAL